MPTTYDASILYCDQGDIEYVLAVLGLKLALDDSRDDLIAAPESTYMDQCIEFATAEINSYLWRRYTPAVLANSSAINECCAVFAAIRARRHRTNPIPESLQDWYDLLIEWLEKVRDNKADIAGAPERSPARPGVINQRHDVRLPNPSRLQWNQSTPPIGRRPFGNDYYDEVAAGI